MAWWGEQHPVLHLRYAYRQTDRETHIQTDGQAGRQATERHRDAERKRQEHIDRDRDRQAGEQIGGQKERQAQDTETRR